METESQEEGEGIGEKKQHNHLIPQLHKGRLETGAVCGVMNNSSCIDDDENSEKSVKTQNCETHQSGPFQQVVQGSSTENVTPQNNLQHPAGRVCSSTEHQPQVVPVESETQAVVETCSYNLPEVTVISCPESTRSMSQCRYSTAGPEGLSGSAVGGEMEVEAHVKNISMKDLSELFANDDAVSVVIISEESDPLEWQQQTDAIEKQSGSISGGLDGSGSQTPEIKFVSAVGSDVLSCVDTVIQLYTVNSEQETVVTACTEEIGVSRKRSSSSSQSHTAPKIQRLPPAEDSQSSDSLGNHAFPHLDSGVSDNHCSQQTKANTQESHSVISTVASSTKLKLSTVSSVSVSNSCSPCVSIHTSLSPTTKGSIGVKQGQVSDSQLVKISPQLTVDGKDPIRTEQSQTETQPSADTNKITFLRSERRLNQEPSSPSNTQQADVSSSGSNVCVVNSDMVYRCAECDYASSNKHYYKQHVDLVHKTARPFKCPFCDYAGKRGHALREHLIVHSMEKPFSCTQCNATFRKKAHLTSHTKLHSVKYSSGSDVMKVGTDPRSSGHMVVFTSSAGSSIALPAGTTSSSGIVVKESPAVSVRCEASVAGAGNAAAAFWCALCKQAMADANAFQAHLQSVHGTDRLFVCERCDFVAADRSSILAHLPTHFTSTTGTAATSTMPSTCRPLYSCTECDFTTPSMNQLRAHALSHTTAAATSPKEQSQEMWQSQQQMAVSKVICSECGLVADDAEAMRTHMWTHISQNTEMKDKSSFTTTEIQQPMSGAGGSSVMQVIQGSPSELAGIKLLPQNAAFRCTECSYTSRDASLFVKHMLVHKARQKPVVISKLRQAPVNSNQTQTAVAGSDETITLPVGSNGKSSQLYQVKPVTTENTCKNTETSPFVHDASTGRFRCTICGYTCEYQRTIKAHIWKHSGHHQVDYPIFQNGPLSVYEDPAPAPVKVIEMNAPAAAAVKGGDPVTPTTVLGGKMVLTSCTTDQSPVPKEVLVPVSGGVTPVPGLKIVKVTDIPPQAVSGSSPSKPSIVAAPSSSQQLPANAAEKHIIVRIQSGPTDSKAALRNEVTVKQAPQVVSGEEYTEKTSDAVPRRKDLLQVKTFNTDKADVGAMKNVTMKALQGSSEANTTPNASMIILHKASPAVSGILTQTSSDSLKATPVSQYAGSAKFGTSIISATASSSVTSNNGVVGDMSKKNEETSCAGSADINSIDSQGNRISQMHEESEVAWFDDKQLNENSSTAEGKKTKSSFPVLAPNVVVEAVPSIPVSSPLTSLQNSSLQVLHSQSPSPHAVSIHLSQCSPEAKDTVFVSEGDATQTSSLKDSQPQSHKKDTTLKVQNEFPKQQDEATTISATSNQSPPTDSESAVTLLSLLRRGPNFNPAYPQGTAGRFNSEPASDSAMAHQSPDRPPSVGSDSDSKGVSGGDQASEDTASEVESTASGKTRGGSGGICSSLLAVIEQLRERSRSESDVEDRSVQSQPKKRTARRRGRRESPEEALGPEDGDNIEQLEGEDGVTYRCKLCHYTSTRTPLIRLHMRTHRQKDPFECSLCPLVAESSEALQEHMIQHCKVRTYPCKFCPQSFNHKSTLRAHMRAHNDSDPFLCDLCDFESSNPLDYRAHMQKHAGLALLQCPNCPALVASQQDLQSHLAGGCSTKGQQVVEAQQTNVPMASMSGTEMFIPRDRLVCSQCEFSAPDLAGLREHMIANHAYGAEMGLGANEAGEGLLHCALCEFTAVSSRSLKSHMKRHANDQRYVQQPLEQYKCALCGYVCHHLPSLKSHMWRHASDQNYSYQFTNDVINAAIDYDTKVDLVPSTTNKGSADEEPELLERFLSAERRIMEGQLSKMVSVGSDPLCWVTFRCCQCGFETINKAKLNLHMRTHADIINRTLKIKVGSSSASNPAPDDVDTDKVKLKIVYEPV